MKYLKLLAILGPIALSGCSSIIDETPLSPRYGDRPGDPCIKCGEDWIFIPNEPYAAIRQSKRVYGFEWGDPNKNPPF